MFFTQHYITLPCVTKHVTAPGTHYIRYISNAAVCPEIHPFEIKERMMRPKHMVTWSELMIEEKEISPVLPHLQRKTQLFPEVYRCSLLQILNIQYIDLHCKCLQILEFLLNCRRLTTIVWVAPGNNGSIGQDRSKFPRCSLNLLHIP